MANCAHNPVLDQAGKTWFLGKDFDVSFLGGTNQDFLAYARSNCSHSQNSDEEGLHAEPICILEIEKESKEEYGK